MLICSPQPADLAGHLRRAGAAVRSDGAGRLAVTGLDAPAIAGVAAARGIAIHELTPQQASLEEAVMRLTHGNAEFHASAPDPAEPGE